MGCLRQCPVRSDEFTDMQIPNFTLQSHPLYYFVSLHCIYKQEITLLYVLELQARAKRHEKEVKG
jgi:hypothetical protein